MLEFLKMKIIFGIALCLVAIVLLDSHVDAYALNYRHSSSEESSSDESGSRERDWDRGRDRDKDWNRDRDWDKNKNKKNFVCPSSYGNFADVDDCSSFFVCQKWKSKWRSCQRNKRFDRYRRTCLPYIIAVCDDGKGDKEATKEQIETTTPKENSFTCPSFMGTFPHPEDCSMYYDCAFYVPSLRTCPKKKLFDGVKKKCKAEREVNCGSRRRPGETTLGTTPTRPEPSTPRSSPRPTPPRPSTPHSSPRPTDQTPSTPRSSPRPTPPRPSTPRSSPRPTDQTPSTPRSSPRPTPSRPSTPRSSPRPTDQTPSTPRSSPRPTPPTPPTPITRYPTTPQRITPPTPKPTTTPGTTPEPTGPPETDCDEDDLDCIIKETGEIPTWFKCPEAVGAYRHPSSNKLFIFCMNWKPSVKKCGQDLLYSDEMRTCITPPDEFLSTSMSVE